MTRDVQEVVCLIDCRFCEIDRFNGGHVGKKFEGRGGATNEQNTSSLELHTAQVPIRTSKLLVSKITFYHAAQFMTLASFCLETDVVPFSVNMHIG